MKKRNGRMREKREGVREYNILLFYKKGRKWKEEINTSR